MNDFFTRPLWLTTTGYHRAVVLTKLAAIAQKNGATFPEPQSYECEREIHHRYSDKMIFTRYKSYIKFIHNGIYYYLEADDNPFFGAKIIKSPMISPEVYRDVFFEDFEWFYYDPLFDADASDKILQECAETIWHNLITRKCCELTYHKTPSKVRKINGIGWYYDNDTAPFRTRTI